MRNAASEVDRSTHISRIVSHAKNLITTSTCYSTRRSLAATARSMVAGSRRSISLTHGPHSWNWGAAEPRQTLKLEEMCWKRNERYQSRKEVKKKKLDCQLVALHSSQVSLPSHPKHFGSTTSTTGNANFEPSTFIFLHSPHRSPTSTSETRIGKRASLPGWWGTLLHICGDCAVI